MDVKQKNFKDETKSLFLKYTAIPILLTIILFLAFTFFILKVKIILDTKQSAANIEEEMMHVFDTYTKEIERMANLPAVLETLETSSKNHLVYEEFYNFNNQQDIKSAFHLVNKRRIFLASTTLSNDDVNKKIINEIIYRLDKNPDEIFLDASRTQYSHGKGTVYNFGKAIKEKDQVIGYLIYQLYEEDLQQLIFGEKADIVVVADQYDYIVVTTNGIVNGLMNKFNPEILSNSNVKIKDDHYYMNRLVTPNEQFTIYTLKNVKDGSIIKILYSVFLLVISIMLFFLLKNLAEKMSSKNVESIDKLVEAVSRLEKGDMKSYVDIHTGDEFEVLADHFNTMLDNLNELLEKNEELSNIRRTKEIKLLESQFNPHFLFNVLETLRYTMFVNIEQAQEIIFSLSRLLRYSIHHDVQQVTFESDLNYIVDYLKLHKYRFGDRLDYHIEVEDMVKQIKVPRLLLQPLIENAIKFGYTSRTHLTIKITGEVHGNHITFTVIDNGGGMEKEKLAQIRKSLESTSVTTGIGLYNTHRRIALQYGEKYGLTIDSLPGEGTKVKLTIPYEQEAVLIV